MLPSKLVVPATAACFAVLVVSWWQRRRRQRALQQAARALRKQRDEKPHACLTGVGIKSTNRKQECRILSSSAHQLREMMATGQVKCVDVMHVFIARARIFGRDTLGLNAITEELYDEALARAAYIDTLPPAAWADLEKYPLLGIPVSIKDQFDQVGCYSTMGLACRCTAPKSQDALIIKALVEAGAIPFVRSNTCQFLMMAETDNNIWGQSRNPWNMTRTPGGSSGGEGALVGGFISPLGLGTDIGGSIRIPAHFCGCAGFKPSIGRMSDQGVGVARRNDRNGQLLIPSTSGPLARSVDDLAACVKAVFNSPEHRSDLSKVPLKFDEEMYRSGKRGNELRVGVLHSDKWFTPAPSCSRALLEAETALNAQGVTTMPLDLGALSDALDGWEVARLYYGLSAADGNMKCFVDALEGESLMPFYRTLYLLTCVPNWLRPPIASILALCGERRKELMLRSTSNGGLTVRQYWDLGASLTSFRQKWLELLRKHDLDAVIAPVVALPAVPHGACATLTPMFSYTFVANLLMWPCGVVPVTTVSESEDRVGYPQNADLPPRERDSLAAAARLAMRGSRGLPLGVQVMSPPFTDERCLHVMRLIETEVKFQARPSCADFTV